SSSNCRVQTPRGGSSAARPRSSLPCAAAGSRSGRLAVSTSSPKKSSVPGVARSNSLAFLAFVLLPFSGIAALALKMLRPALLKQPVGPSPMTARRNSAPPPDGAHFREIAQGLRTLARRCRYPGARKELLELATSFDRRADHFDAHQSPVAELDPSAG